MGEVRTLQNRARGVPNQERDLAASAHPDWEDLRAFLSVARGGSFRAAAGRASVNTLRRRVESLEASIGALVFVRHIDGVTLTPEGERVREIAERMEAASLRLEDVQFRGEPEIEGVVRVGVTEGLGTFWLAPRLVEFQRAYPKILVDLACEMRQADVLRLEVDVAVQLTPPKRPTLKCVKVGRLHVMPFASDTYLNAFGVPKTVEELASKHRLVIQSGEQTRTAEMFEKYAKGSQVGRVAIQSTSASTCLWAIIKGSGIGFAPTYVHAIGGPVIPVDIPELRMGFDIWLTYHPDVRDLPRTKQLIDWLKESFSPAHFPWFGDDFVHPDELVKAYRGPVPFSNLFSGFVWPRAQR